MADPSGHTRDDLTSLARDTAEIDFFELLRRLEGDGRRFGRAGGPDKEPARLGQPVRLAFATSDVAEISEFADRTETHTDGPVRIDVNVLGLLGPEGPMPLHLTRWAIARMSNRWFAGDAQGASSDTSFLDFCNVLQHRVIALYWRAWADAHPEVEIAHEGSGVSAVLRALSGTGLPGTRTGAPDRSAAKITHATSLARQVQDPDRLVSYLTTVVGDKVDIREFVGSWSDIDGSLQSRLGSAHAALGQSTVLGARTFTRHERAELRIGPLSIEAFLEFLDVPEKLSELRHALLFAGGQELAFDLRLVLAAPDVPEARLGMCRLGRTTWLNPVQGKDADDLRFGNLTDPRWEDAA